MEKRGVMGYLHGLRPLHGDCTTPVRPLSLGQLERRPLTGGPSFWPCALHNGSIWVCQHKLLVERRDRLLTRRGPGGGGGAFILKTVYMISCSTL